MGHPAEKRVRATYADLEAAPPHFVAEIIDGVLHLQPRPAPRHARASTRITIELGGPFDLGRNGPGGWHILDEPELHFPHPTKPGESEVLVPDIAGWRVERLTELPETSYFELAPDWICEVLSPSTEDRDRNEKMPIYARERVRFAWLVAPLERSLEVYALEGSEWLRLAIHRDDARVRVPPFDAIELELGLLWEK